MPKHSFQDVVPPDRRSIRNIPIPANKKPSIYYKLPERPVAVDEQPRHKLEEGAEEVEIHKGVPRDPERRGYGAVLDMHEPPKKTGGFPTSKVLISIAGVLILAFIFFMMSVFTSANVRINPKKENVTFDMALQASSLQPSIASSTSALKYEVIELSKQGEKEVSASGEEQVENKASGKIVVYNNFSDEPQRLIARTRFETPEGLIFRINDSVTIPGKTSSGPGSLTVTIYADEAGEKYNVGLKDFTIPGFKDDAARYKGFYARSKDKIAGGFIGKMKKVSKAEADAANLELDNSLKEDLSKEIASKIPENLVVLSGATLYDFSSLPQTDSGSKVLLKREAKLYAIAFDKSALSKVIENQFLKSWAGLPAEILSYEKATLTFEDPAWRPATGSNAVVKIKGEALMAATLDEEAIADQLVGKNRTALGEIVNATKAIESAEVSIRPVWKNSFPDTASKININLAY